MKKMMMMFVALGLLSTGAFAQDENEDTLDVVAEILEEIKLECDTPLDMGKFVGQYGVESALSTDDQERAGNAANVGSLGQCIATGAEDSVFFILVEDAADDLNRNAATVEHETEADVLNVELIDHDLQGAIENGVQTYTMPSSGELEINIDGKIDLTDSFGKAPGVYEGQAVLRAEY